LLGVALLSCGGAKQEVARPASVEPPGQPRALRLGHFPNLTHAQAVLGRATGEYSKATGVLIDWRQFNAGPSAVEAMFAGAIDATYVGPNPAINGFVKSRGESFVVLAGAASGGAALVVRGDAGIASEADFHGKVVATPQLGNTQDVAARLWFSARGYTLAERGGDLTILPLANPDQLLMMQKRQIHGAWTVEPWVSRLEQEAGGRILLEEKSLWSDGRYATAVLIVRRAFLRDNPGLVDKLLGAHVEVTRRLQSREEGLGALLAGEIQRETASALPDRVVESALARLDFTWEPMAGALQKAADDAHNVGFLSERPDLRGLFELAPLAGVLAAKGLPAITTAPRELDVGSRP